MDGAARMKAVMRTLFAVVAGWYCWVVVAVDWSSSSPLFPANFDGKHPST